MNMSMSKPHVPTVLVVLIIVVILGGLYHFAHKH